MLKLKLQYFGHLMQRADSFAKTLMLERLKLGGEGDDRGWDGWVASPTQWTWAWLSSGSWWLIGKPGVLQSMGSQRVRHDWVTELNWTEHSLPLPPQGRSGIHLFSYVALSLSQKILCSSVSPQSNFWPGHTLECETGFDNLLCKFCTWFSTSFEMWNTSLVA